MSTLQRHVAVVSRTPLSREVLLRPGQFAESKLTEAERIRELARAEYERNPAPPLPAAVLQALASLVPVLPPPRERRSAPPQ